VGGLFKTKKSSKSVQLSRTRNLRSSRVSQVLEFFTGLSLFASLPSSTEKKQSSGSAVVRDDEYGVFILDDGNVAPFDNHGP
jgi:hypothetical protein